MKNKSKLLNITDSKLFNNVVVTGIFTGGLLLAASAGHLIGEGMVKIAAPFLEKC